MNAAASQVPDTTYASSTGSKASTYAAAPPHSNRTNSNANTSDAMMIAHWTERDAAGNVWVTANLCRGNCSKNRGSRLV
jgi:hypothetical protein